MTAQPQERVTLLRWLVIIALFALFVSDYGLDAWVKPVPNTAYGLLLAVALGVDLPALRSLMIRFAENFVEKK